MHWVHEPFQQKAKIAYLVNLSQGSEYKFKQAGKDGDYSKKSLFRE